LNEDNSQTRIDFGNDNDKKTVKRSFLSNFIMGLQFYSRLSFGAKKYETPNLSRIAPALAFVSIIIAIFPAILLFAGVTIGLPTLFSAGLAIIAWVLITGAMAEDAIADSADGLFGGHSVEQRLKIFKDSTLGTYGVSALVIFIAMRIFAYAGIATSSPLMAACLFIGVSVLARSSALWLVIKLPPARSDGVSASIGQLSKPAFYIGMAFAIVVSFSLIIPFVEVTYFIAAIAVILVINYAWSLLCKSKVNGQTGDLIGGLQALTELGILCVFLVAT